MVAAEMGISAATLFNYTAGKTQMPDKRIATFCEIVDCSPLYLLPTDWRMLYEDMWSQVEDFIEDDQKFIEKSAELRGWSRELRQWRRFFELVGEDDLDIEPSEAQQLLEENIEKELMPEGTEDPAEDL